MEEKKYPIERELLVERLTKKIVPSGTSAHIPIEKKFIGDIAHIEIFKKFRICLRCSETITPEGFSPDPTLCMDCYTGLKKLKQLKDSGNFKCRKCGKAISEDEFKEAWDDPICRECWVKEAEEFSKKSNVTNFKPLKRGGSKA